MTEPRKADYPIDPMFIERWSPRAFDGATMPEADLLTMFEAARWAPSAYNSQPWRFLYALRDTPSWDRFLGLLVPFNQSWAKETSALVFLVSNSTMVPPGKDQAIPSHSHSLDAGAASSNFALQANKLGYYVHGMVGFDMDRAFAELGVPKGYRVEAAYAVGRLGDQVEAAGRCCRRREFPSPRLPVSAIAFEGGFKE